MVTEKDVKETDAQPIQDLKCVLEDLTMRNTLESFHDAQQALEMTHQLFNTGNLSLEQRALAENLFWSVICIIKKILPNLDYVPEDLPNG